MKNYQKRGLLVGLLLAGAVVVVFNVPHSDNALTAPTPALAPIKEGVFAQKYAPLVLHNERYGTPQSLLYRASRDGGGYTHITYHFVWEKEENTAQGWKPFLSRWIYTGGLGIQKTMFGKKDIEQVSLVVSPNGEVVQVMYETAFNYNDADFSVQHKTVVLDGKFKTPLVFDVISWNHLFTLVDGETTASQGAPVKLQPGYFTQALWQEYAMVKTRQTRLSRNRAHLAYEREFVQD